MDNRTDIAAIPPTETSFFNRYRILLYPVTLAILMIIWWHISGDLIALYSEYWARAVTMILGAFVAGSTPLGGGAVSFPVFTKVLGVSAADAGLFAILIQSVGMTCASLLFISLSRKIYWREIFIGLLISAVIPRLLMSMFQIGNDIPGMIFIAFETLALVVIIFQKDVMEQHEGKAFYTPLLIFAFLGGLLTVVLGSGADLMIFIYFVLFQKIPPVKAIPSSVVFMALNSLLSTGYVVSTSEINEATYYSWLAAAPVVALAAPLGGWIINVVSATIVIRFVVTLILIDLFTSIIWMDLPILVVFIILASLLAIGAVKLFPSLMTPFKSWNLTFQNRSDL